MIVLIERVGGAVSIMRLTDEAKSVQEEIEKWSGVHPGEYVSHRTINESDVPQDKTFRDSWGTDLKVGMAKARNIQRQRMREARAPKLQVLDVAYVRALEGGDAAGAQTIAAQKQTLRDVTAHPDIEAASTPEELKAVWPQCLK